MSGSFEDNSTRAWNEIDISPSARIAPMKSFGSRVAGTMTVGVGWIVFILLWLAFYAGNFDFWQNLAVFLASVIVAIGITAVMWVEWAL
jgi:hypothetical protein